MSARRSRLEPSAGRCQSVAGGRSLQAHGSDDRQAPEFSAETRRIPHQPLAVRTCRLEMAVQLDRPEADAGHDAQNVSGRAASKHPHPQHAGRDRCGHVLRGCQREPPRRTGNKIESDAIGPGLRNHAGVGRSGHAANLDLKHARSTGPAAGISNAVAGAPKCAPTRPNVAHHPWVVPAPHSRRNRPNGARPPDRESCRLGPRGTGVGSRWSKETVAEGAWRPSGIPPFNGSTPADDRTSPPSVQPSLPRGATCRVLPPGTRNRCGGARARSGHPPC